MCRLAYELMQTHHIDGSRLAYSLDDIYYYGGQQQHNMRAFHSHTEERHGHMTFRKGDLLNIHGNLRNGFSTSQNKKQGLFPSYIVEEEIFIADFPTYPEVL